MLFATVNREKVEAKPNTTGLCPLCARAVFSKCGEINVWHWAHHKNERCDSWYKSPTEWDKNWKLVFGKDNCEIVILKDGVRHVADIVTKDNLVIVLQNSPVPLPIIRDREIFFGDRMIWIINGKRFKDNFSIFKNRLKEDEAYNRFNNPTSKDYGMLDNSPKNDFDFSWSRYKKSWCDVQRRVFIDFGDEYLFWVQEGMGTGYGKGKKITKQDFIKKYGGDVDLLKTIIDT